MTVGDVFDIDGSAKTRRTMSESDVSSDGKCVNPANLSEARLGEQKRCHSLPHRYKVIQRPKSISGTSLKAGGCCYSPQRFRRDLAAMEAWFARLNDSQRTAALQSLTPHLGASQFHWLAVNLAGQGHADLHSLCSAGCMDPFRWLPSLLTCKVLSYLDPLTLVRCRRVCQHWRALVDSDWIWQRLCYIPRWRLSSTDDNMVQLDRQHSFSWRQVFRERYKLRRSWLRGRCHVRTFEGHSGGISCVQFDASRIVSGSHDKTIRVWNMKTNSPWSVMTLTGHSGEVRCLHLEANRLVSGSADTTIKVWDLDMQPKYSSIACRVTMVGHLATVRCVQMNTAKSMVISGSYDETLKLWCLKTGRCLKTLRGHTGHVLCVFWPEATGDSVVSGSQDKTIKVWSVGSGSCTKTLSGHVDAVTCVTVEANKIISGSLDRTLKLWSLETGDCVSTLDWMTSEGHTGVIRCLQADSWRIVSSSDDKTLKVWCLESGQRLVTLRSHTDGVTCLQFNDFYLVSGSYDKTVKLWDFTVC